MLFVRIDGHATSSMSHPSLKGQKIVLCTPIDEKGRTTGLPVAALDLFGSGLHSKVFVTTDGSWSQDILGDETSPIRNQVIGIID